MASHSAELRASWQTALAAAVRDGLANGGMSEHVMEDTVTRIVSESNTDMMDKMAAARKNWISDHITTVDSSGGPCTQGGQVLLYSPH